MSETIDEYLDRRLAELKAGHRYREPDDGALRREAFAAAGALQRPVLDASSNDYLGLAGRSVSRETLAAWAVTVGSGASRLIHGSRAAHVALEVELASWVRRPTALLFSSGYAANVGALAGLLDAQSVIVSDELNHASIIDGCRLSRANVQIVPHLDLAATERALAGAPPSAPRWVVTESYFSMDGDGPDLSQLRALCDRQGAGLIVDEAHALGLFGPEGSGRCVEAGVVPDVLIGTLGKAVGVHGAFVAGSDSLRRLLWNAARSFVFSTAPSPLMAAAALFHVKQVRAAEGARQVLLQRCEQLRAGLQRSGVNTPAASFGPIVPVMVGDNERAVRIAERLRSRGILTQAIRPPTVPDGTARLRLTVTTATSADQFELLRREVAEALLEHGSIPAQPIGMKARPRRVVVMGTGTGTGKTFVSAALARRLRERGVQVAAVKPVETGVTGPVGADAGLLARASGRSAPAAFAFPEPLTPRLAAERAGRPLELNELVQVVTAVEASDNMLQCMVVETAGGVFSPLTAGATNFELALALEPAEWVLVAPDSLGVLHDVSATVRAMTLQGRPPDHIILSAARPPDASSGRNAAELTALGHAPATVLAAGDESSIDTLLAALGW